MGMINNEAVLTIKDDKWVHTGDAIDTAFLALGLKASIKDVPKIEYRIPYEPEQKYSAVFFKEKGRNSYEQSYSNRSR